MFDGIWFKDIEKQGKGFIMFKGGRYTGSVSGGIPDGQGTLEYENGDKYTGEWKLGKRDGPGEFLQSRREKPVWEIDESAPEIVNSKDFARARNITAIWENDQIKDKSNATLIFIDGYILKGTWHDINITDGKYQGFMQGLKPDGYGKITYNNGGYTYQGFWKSGKIIEGEMITTYSSGSKYAGGWAHGKPSGFGIMVYLDNSKIMSNRDWTESGAYYVGQWKEGLIDGQGTVYYKSGDISYQGIFDMGKCSEDCHSYYKVI